VEQYFEADPSHRGIQGSLTYVRLDADLDHGVKLVGSFVQTPGYPWLDETYAEWEHGRDIFRLGRIRSDFGFSTWSDLYYTPIIGLPMIRNYNVDIVPGISLYREDRGFEWESYNGPVQWQLEAVDSSDNDWAIAPGSLDTGIARLQLCAGPVLIGLDGFAKGADNFGPAQQIGGLDLRYTTGRAQFRGEVDQGLGHQGATGYYADAFYRPPGLSRTQVGVRYQGIRSLETEEYWSPGWTYSWQEQSFTSGHVTTLAARQFIGPNITASLNYGFGTDIPQAVGLLGWSGQVMLSVRF
jgi:hypothetical protein